MHITYLKATSCTPFCKTKTNQKKFKSSKVQKSEALLTVDRDTGINYFRRCGIPGSHLMFTASEYDQILHQLQIQL